jgi:hypothetical protein
MCLLLLASVLFSFCSPNTDRLKREIILLAEDKMNPDLLQQERILRSNEAGLGDRDITITIVTPLSDKKRYDTLMKNRKGFVCILIGKDGSEKLISESPVSLQQLFGLIDSMPMRRYEIQTRLPHL